MIEQFNQPNNVSKSETRVEEIKTIDILDIPEVFHEDERRWKMPDAEGYTKTYFFNEDHTLSEMKQIKGSIDEVENFFKGEYNKFSVDDDGEYNILREMPSPSETSVKTYMRAMDLSEEIAKRVKEAHSFIEENYHDLDETTDYEDVSVIKNPSVINELALMKTHDGKGSVNTNTGYERNIVVGDFTISHHGAYLKLKDYFNELVSNGKLYEY